ncbi:MAG: hypothetical protein ABJM29_09820 [Rhizobiaceae bacterium]
MTRFFLALIRLMALALSFILSTLIAACFVTFALFLGGEAHWLHNDPEVLFSSIGFTFGVWVEISRALFAPFLLFALIAEPARLTGLITNVVLGGALAAIYMVITPYTFELPYSQQELWITALAAGFVGGLAHWIFAGNRAGRWLGPPKVSPSQAEQ